MLKSANLRIVVVWVFAGAFLSFGGRIHASAAPPAHDPSVVDRYVNAAVASDDEAVPVYTFCGEPVSQAEWVECQLFEQNYTDILSAIGFEGTFDVCTEWDFLRLDAEPMMYEDISIEPIVNPHDPNQVIPAQVRDLPAVGERITGQRMLDAGGGQPFCVQVINNLPGKVFEDALPPDLQGINATESWLVAYISAHPSMLDPNDFDPNGPHVVAVEGLCWSSDQPGGRLTKFWPMQLLSPENLSAHVLHGEIQAGWVTQQRDLDYHPCPQAAGDPVFGACQKWADGTLDNCLSSAFSNLQNTLAVIGVGLTAASAGCIVTAPTIAGFFVCLEISLFTAGSAALAAMTAYADARNGCLAQHDTNMQLCCDMFCATNPGAC